MMMRRIQQIGFSLLLLAGAAAGFVTAPRRPAAALLSSSDITKSTPTAPTTAIAAATPDLDVVALVAGQENYGLAVVCVGEALWSFFQAPSLSHAKVLVPAAIAALVLVVFSGPMITSGDASSVSTGLFIATGVSLGLGLSYVARLLAPFSPSAKEIAFLGLLISFAGFASFSQNLIVDGFVTLPDIPLPKIQLPTTDWGDDIPDNVPAASFINVDGAPVSDSDIPAGAVPVPEAPPAASEVAVPAVSE